MTKSFKKPESRAAEEFTYISAKSVFEGLELTDSAPTLDEGHEVIQGIFKEEVPNAKSPNKNDFKFELEDGKEVIVNNAGNLGYCMKFIDSGDYCQILYFGKKPISKGQWAGTLSHNFDVKVAE